MLVGEAQLVLRLRTCALGLLASASPAFADAHPFMRGAYKNLVKDKLASLWER